MYIKGMKDLTERIFDFCSNKPTEQIILIDGLESAFVGLARRGAITAACYDYERCIEVLINEGGMSKEEAVDFVEYNIDKNWVGCNTPFFVNKFDDS